VKLCIIGFSLFLLAEAIAARTRSFRASSNYNGQFLFTPKTNGGKLGGNSGSNQSNRTTTVVLDATSL
jgi:hypothetical protein